jgi:hypothetical protein
MRILHIVQPRPAHATLLHTPALCDHTSVLSLAGLRSLIATTRSHEHFVACMGSDEAQAIAASAGLRRVIPLSPALGSSTLAGPTTRRLLAALGSVDIALAWGNFASTLAFKCPLASGIWMQLSPASGIIHALSSRAEHIDSGCTLPWRLDLPELLANDAHNQARTREQLGLPANTLTLSLMADHFTQGDACDYVLLLSVLASAGVHVNAIMPTSAPAADRAQWLIRRSSYARHVALVRAAPRAWLPACDISIIADAPPLLAGFSLCQALSHNTTPILSRSTLDTLGLSSLTHLGALSSRATDLARVVLPLASDAALRESHRREFLAALQSLREPTFSQGFDAFLRSQLAHA